MSDINNLVYESTLGQAATWGIGSGLAAYAAHKASEDKKPKQFRMMSPQAKALHKAKMKKLRKAVAAATGVGSLTGAIGSIA